MVPKADHVLFHFMPVEVLAKARALAVRFQKEEAFRTYVSRRLWWVFPFSFAVLVVGFFALFYGAALAAQAFFPPPVPALARYMLLPVVLVPWTVLSLGFLYVFLGWLEKRAGVSGRR